jgi:hypothetical protein
MRLGLESYNCSMEQALTLNLNLIVVDPDWTPIYGADRCAVNMDTRHVYRDFEVEVLTVHFEKNTMRIRFRHGGRVETRDVDATPFFEKYRIVCS